MNEIIECIVNRVSVRNFQDKPIDKETLQLIAKAGINAPNGLNKQTWRFTILNQSNQISEFKNQVESTLERTKTDTMHGFDNPMAIIIVSDRKTNHNAIANGSCALENMMLAAYSLGIGSCWLNALRTIQDDEEIRQNLLGKFGIPDNHMVVGCLMLGYMDEERIFKKPRRRNDVIHFVEEL